MLWFPEIVPVSMVKLPLSYTPPPLLAVFPVTLLSPDMVNVPLLYTPPPLELAVFPEIVPPDM